MLYQTRPRTLWRHAARSLALLALGLIALLTACAGQAASAFNHPAPGAAGEIVATTSEDGRGGTVLVGLRGRDDTVAWQTPIGQTMNDAPLVMEGVIYTEGEERLQQSPSSPPPSAAVLAVRLADGMVLWRTAIPTNSLQLTAGATSVIVAAGTAGLYALDPTTGTVLWHQAAPTYGPPLAGGGAVVVQVNDVVVGKDGPPVTAADSGLWAFRERDGAVLWTAGQLAAVALDHVAIYGNVGNLTAARRLSDDHYLWEYDGLHPANGVITQTFLFAVGGGLALVATNGRLVALDTRTGEVQWQSPYAFTDTPTSFIDIGGGLFAPGPGSVPAIYLTHHGILVALRASDGTLLWQTAIPNYRDGSILGLLVQDGALFTLVEGPPCGHVGLVTSCAPNRLAALDTSTGAIAWWRDAPTTLTLAR